MSDEKLNEAETEEEQVIILTDEEGNESEWTIAQVIEVDGKQYAILIPVGADADNEEAVMLRIEHDDTTGEDELVEVTDEEEFERVAIAWDELLDEAGELEDEPQ